VSPADTSVDPTVTARLVHNAEDDLENLEGRFQQQQEQLEELQRRQENVVVGQVLGAHDNNFDENDDEEEAGSVGSNNDDLPSSNISLFNSKRKVTFALMVIILVVIAIIVVSVVISLPPRRQGLGLIPIRHRHQQSCHHQWIHHLQWETVQCHHQHKLLLRRYLLLLRRCHRHQHKCQPSLTRPSISLTGIPMVALTSTLQDLVDLLSLVSFDNGAALQAPSTPQNNALLLWLSNNINLDAYSDEKRIQRYALATFFYSTNGDNRKRNTGWITDVDECDWYN
jgi:hypothetical protein